MDARSITSKANGIKGGRPKRYLPLTPIEGEKWAMVAGHDGYMVSDHCRVMSLQWKGAIVRQVEHADGYDVVKIGGKVKRVMDLSDIPFGVKVAARGPVVYRGVKELDSGKWMAIITQGRKKQPIGIFHTPEVAAAAYNTKATELGFGVEELNVIDD